MVFTAPAEAGEYEFRLLLADGYEVAARSQPVTVHPASPRLFATPAPVVMLPGTAGLKVSISDMEEVGLREHLIEGPSRVTQSNPLPILKPRLEDVLVESAGVPVAWEEF
jgi:hypothetical protein